MFADDRTVLVDAEAAEAPLKFADCSPIVHQTEAEGEANHEPLEVDGQAVLKAAFPYRMWPLGEQRASSSDGGMLSDEQVVACASVLLFSMLDETDTLNTWVTDLITLRLLRDGDCPSDLLSWLQSRNVTVYVVACLGPYGFVQEGDGHWICFSVETPSSTECKVKIYDSKGFESINWRWNQMRSEICEASKWISKMKFDSDPVPRAEIVTVRTDDIQEDNANCGFHVGLFIAQDAALRVLSDSESLDRVARLRNCPSTVQVLRDWLEEHTAGFGVPSVSFGDPPDRLAARNAFETLSSRMIPLQIGLETRDGDFCGRGEGFFSCWLRCTRRCRSIFNDQGDDARGPGLIRQTSFPSSTASTTPSQSQEIRAPLNSEG